MKLTFNLTLLSDFHIKAGYGKGIIDSLILKDRNGFPVIRGTTLTGLLRQGMWDLLQLDLLKRQRLCQQSGAEENTYCQKEAHLCPVCRILGTPMNPKKWKISSAKILDPTNVKSTKVVWRNRVNPITRTAEARRLFAQEIMGRGTCFEFTVENEQNNTEVLEEAAFIVAAFRMIRNMGASRRKGKGQCCFHLVKVDSVLPGTAEQENNTLEKTMLKIFKTRWLENKELDKAYKNLPKHSVVSLAAVPSAQKRKSFNLVLLTKEPLLIADRSAAGNRFQAVDYIPGETLLGALAWKIANRWDLADEVVYEKFVNLFYKKGLKVSPLYPCYKGKNSNDIYPTIPAPLDFFTCKLEPPHNDEQGHGIWPLASEPKGLKKCPKCLENNFDTPLEQLKRFINFSHENLKTVKVAKREEMHITIIPQTGMAKTGELFGYTTIEEGQYFAGTIEVENWDEFVQLLGIDTSSNSLELRLGKGSSRGYGLVKAWFNEKNIITTFRGKPIEKRVQDWSKPIIMTLLTDAILADCWGRFYTAFDEEILRQILGFDVEVLTAFVRTKNNDGFNVHLGLPKWRAKAIAAGSTVSFKIKNIPPNTSKLMELFEGLEKEGIGLRRVEGYGQIVFNHPIYEKNFDFDVSIRLPEFMRIQSPEEEIKNFESWWQNYLTKKIEKHIFSQSEWVLFVRWLTENKKMFIAAESIDELLMKFHSPEFMLELVDKKKPSRAKKGFLEEDGQMGRKVLLDIFENLYETIRNKDDEIKNHLVTRAIAMLAEFITSCQEVNP